MKLRNRERVDGTTITIGWNVDYLVTTGGELKTSPKLGERYRMEFKENQ